MEGNAGDATARLKAASCDLVQEVEKWIGPIASAESCGRGARGPRTGASKKKRRAQSGRRAHREPSEKWAIPQTVVATEMPEYEVRDGRVTGREAGEMRARGKLQV